MNWNELWTNYSPLLVDFALNFVSAVVILALGWFVSRLQR